MIYDGTTSLSKAIADDLKLCAIANTNKISKLTQTASKALGLPVDTKGGKKAPADNIAIYQWLKSNALPVTQSNLEPPAKPLPIEQSVTQTAIDNVVPVTQKRNKTKRDKRFSGFTRISFNVTGNTQRQHISLEPEFIKALELIAPANRNQWLNDTVSDYVAKNGVESSTRIVKLSIVNELIKRVTG